MKNRYRIYGTVQVDVAVEIEAHSLEEAIEYAWDNYRMEEYCNGTIGCEDGGYEFDDAELTCCCDIEWTEDGYDIIEENIPEDDDEEEDEEENED